jgi:energy-coupling factor transport system ATP-binding protein
MPLKDKIIINNMDIGIRIENVTFSYDTNVLQLNNISLQIPKRAFFGISGINGSGKTTLGLLLNGLIPNEIRGKLIGDVFIDGINTKKKPVSYFAGKVGMMFQNPDFMLFNLTVYDEIAFGLEKKDISEKVLKALERVGLSGFEKRDPQTLSFGEKQKICLASVLARDTDYIVLDEPAAMLDYKGAAHLYKLLKSLNEEYGKTIIVIEHDTDFLLTYANKTAILNEGKIVLKGNTKSVFSKTEKLRSLGIKIPSNIL